MEGEHFVISGVQIPEALIKPDEVLPKPISDIEFEYGVELRCLKDKVKCLEAHIESLLEQNRELKQRRDEVEAIKLQMKLSDRLAKDMQICRDLEIENKELKHLITSLYEREENKAHIKFRNEDLAAKYDANPSLSISVDEVDMYRTYKNLVNHNDVMKSDNIFLKIELGRLRDVLNTRANVMVESKMLKYDENRLRELISKTLNMPIETKPVPSQMSFGSSYGSDSSEFLSHSNSFKNLISNPFRQRENFGASRPSVKLDKKPNDVSLKSMIHSLEKILDQEKKIQVHLTDKATKFAAKPELRYNSSEIYCKYFLKGSNSNSR